MPIVSDHALNFSISLRYLAIVELASDLENCETSTFMSGLVPLGNFFERCEFLNICNVNIKCE